MHILNAQAGYEIKRQRGLYGFHDPLPTWGNLCSRVFYTEKLVGVSKHELFTTNVCIVIE